MLCIKCAFYTLLFGVLAIEGNLIQNIDLNANAAITARVPTVFRLLLTVQHSCMVDRILSLDERNRACSVHRDVDISSR